MPRVALKKEPYSFGRVVASRSQWLPWLAKGATALMDQGLVGASGFLVNILLARWLPPEQYGAYALAFSIFMVFCSFHTAFLLEPMGVFGPASYRDCLQAYLGKLLRLHFGSTFALALLVGFGISLSRYLLASTGLPSALWGVGIAAPGILLFWLWRQAAYVQLKPGLAARGSAVFALTVVALTFLLYRLGWLSPFTAFFLQAVAGFAASSVLVTSIRPRLRPPLSPPIRGILKQHWEYGRWMIVTGFVYWLSGGVYYVIAGALLRMEDVAGLRALVNFVLPVFQFLIAMGYLLLPWVSARFADQSGPDFRRIVNRISLMLTAAASAYLIGVLLFGRWLIDAFYGGRYTQFASLLPLLALPALLMAASEGPSIALRAMQAPSEIFMGYAVGGIVTILAGVALTRYWGLVGAALGIAASSLAALIVIICRYRATLRKFRPMALRPLPFAHMVVHEEGLPFEAKGPEISTPEAAGVESHTQTPLSRARLSGSKIGASSRVPNVGDGGGIHNSWKNFIVRLGRHLRALRAADLTAASKMRYTVASLRLLFGASGGKGGMYRLNTRRGGPLFLRHGTSDVRVYREIFLHQIYSRLAGEFVQLAQQSAFPRVLDLGANIGLAAAAFKMMCPHARILCVEPEEGNFQILRRNLENLPGPPCQAVRAFVGGKRGTGYVRCAGLEEWAFQISREPLGNAQAVPILDLNSLLDMVGWDRAELMKCDIEGAERELFAVCRDWRSRVDRIIVELHPPYSPEELSRDLRCSGAHYRIAPVDVVALDAKLWLLD